MENRIGVVGIVIESPRETAALVNTILSEFSEVIVGRMGIPYRERNLSVMSLIVDGNTDDIGALTGKLGNIRGVSVKAALTKR